MVKPLINRNRPLATIVPILAALALLLLAGCSGSGAETPEQPAPAAVAAPSLEDSPAPAAGAPTEAEQAFDATNVPTVTPLEKPIELPDEVPDEFRIIWEAWQHLTRDYVDKSKLDSDSFSEEAIRGMLKVLGDPETAYVSPSVLKGDFRDVFRGEFEGIGANVQMNARGSLMIVSPIPGGPAEGAGIVAGDIVLEVNGESLQGLSTMEAVSKIRGPRGTTIVLLVKHLLEPTPVEISVTRGLIPLESVYLRSDPGEEYVHIRLTHYYPDTAEKLGAMVSTAVAQGAKGLILDVRSNGGGLLGSAVDIASLFLDDRLVVYSVNGEGRRSEWSSKRGEVAKDLPMVILVDKGSASASEVLAGALQDHDRATVIGSSTYGKGSVNILRELSNGGGLYITISHWYTPLGRLIQDTGLEPDIEVTDRDSKEADIKQLKRAIEELKRMTATRSTDSLAS